MGIIFLCRLSPFIIFWVDNFWLLFDLGLFFCKVNKILLLVVIEIDLLLVGGDSIEEVLRLVWYFDEITTNLKLYTVHFGIYNNGVFSIQ